MILGILEDIKNDAIRTGAKIQSGDASKLEKILNNAFYLEKQPDLESQFVKDVMTRGLGTQERSGLHASSFIKSDKDFCTRCEVLSLFYKQLQGKQINVGLKRIFEEGNSIHEKWQRLFIRAGYSLPIDLDHTQYDENYHISFTPDIICHIPDFNDGKKVLGELKSVNTFQFKRMTHHPSAGKQLQWYMFLSGIHDGFVLSEDKNTQDFKIEVYEYDPSIVAPFIERAEEVVYYAERLKESHKMVKRPDDATSPSCKRCDACALKDACWNIGSGRVRL